MNERQLATMLAALRAYQSEIALGRGRSNEDIATDGGRFAPLSPREIDDLCQKLNAPANSRRGHPSKQGLSR